MVIPSGTANRTRDPHWAFVTDWTNWETAKRYYIAEGFVVFDAVCDNCLTQLNAICYPGVETNLECPVCRICTVNRLDQDAEDPPFR